MNFAKQINFSLPERERVEITNRNFNDLWNRATDADSRITTLDSLVAALQSQVVTTNNTINNIPSGGGGGGGAGTVTSVAQTVPVGFAIAGSPIIAAGTLAISYAAGYALPTIADVANGVTAFGWGNHAGLYPTLAVYNGHDHSAGDPTQVAYANLTGIPGSFTPSAHNLLSGSHGDTTIGAAAVGAIITGQLGPVWQVLAPNATATNKFLRSVSSAAASWEQVGWADLSGVPGSFTPSAHAIDDNAIHSAGALTSTYFPYWLTNKLSNSVISQVTNFIGIGQAVPGYRLHVVSADGVSDNSYVMYIDNQEATVDRNNGLWIKAGSSASDYNIRCSDKSGNELWSVDGAGYLTTIKAHIGKLGHVVDEINEIDTNSDAGCIYINYSGYQFGTTHFRNLWIGDGKNNSVIEVDGTTQLTTMQGSCTIGGTLIVGTLSGALVSAVGTVSAITPVLGDIFVGLAGPLWGRYALSVPAANVRNVLGVDNGETVPTWKAALDATNPTTIGISDAAAPGTSLVFAHRDHQHASPATWTATAHNLLSTIHGDTTAQAAVVGGLITGQAGPVWAYLAGNTTATNKFLRTVSSGAPSWEQVGYADLSGFPAILTTLGALANAAGVLTNNGAGVLSWGAGGGAHNFLSATHSDTTAGSPTLGDLVYAGAGPVWTKLAVGALGTVLCGSATIPAYNSAVYIGTSLGIGITSGVTGMLELQSAAASPVLTITGLHASAYDPCISFRTDNPATVKACIGVDSTDDSIWITAGATLNAARTCVITSYGIESLGFGCGTSATNTVGYNLSAAPSEMTYMGVGVTVNHTLGAGAKNFIARGLYFDARSVYNAATVNSGALIGFEGNAYHNTASSIASVYGGSISFGSTFAAALVTGWARGLNLQGQRIALITNYADIYINAPSTTVTPTNDWCIYSLHAAPSLLSGALGIVTDPWNYYKIADGGGGFWYAQIVADMNASHLDHTGLTIVINNTNVKGAATWGANNTFTYLGQLVQSTGGTINNIINPAGASTLVGLKVTALAGTGSRTVVAAADGTLSAP